MRRVRALVLAVCCVGMVGCSSSGGSGAGDTELTAMLQRYFTAMRDGDIDAAMAERCPAARIDEGDAELSREQTADLFEMGGFTGIEVVDGEAVPVDPVEAIDESVETVLFDYVLLSGDQRSRPLHGVAIDTGEGLQFCGHASTDVVQYREAAVLPPSAGEWDGGELSGLLPVAGPTGWERSEISELTTNANQPDGWLEGWQRAWAAPEYGGLRVEAHRYESPASAAAAVVDTVARVTPDTTQRFTFDDVPNALGVRYSGAAWTWLQPPDIGYQIDRISMLFGDVVVFILMGGLPPDAGHEIVQSIARNTLADA